MKKKNVQLEKYLSISQSEVKDSADYQSKKYEILNQKVVNQYQDYQAKYRELNSQIAQLQADNRAYIRNETILKSLLKERDGTVQSLTEKLNERSAYDIHKSNSERLQEIVGNLRQEITRLRGIIIKRVDKHYFDNEK